MKTTETFKVVEELNSKLMASEACVRALRQEVSELCDKQESMQKAIDIVVIELALLRKCSQDLLQAISDNIEPPSGMINSQYLADEIDDLQQALNKKR